MVRGRGFSPIEDISYEWRATGPSRKTVFLREAANGMIEIVGHRKFYDTIDEAVDQLAAILIPPKPPSPGL